MFKKRFILLIFFCLSFQGIDAQLEKLSAPNLYSDVEIYVDEKGNWYSTSITVNFSRRTIELQRGIKNARFSDIKKIKCC